MMVIGGVVYKIDRRGPWGDNIQKLINRTLMIPNLDIDPRFTEKVYPVLSAVPLDFYYCKLR
jgi:hypothetical protein